MPLCGENTGIQKIAQRLSHFVPKDVELEDGTRGSMTKERAKGTQRYYQHIQGRFDHFRYKVKALATIKGENLKEKNGESLVGGTLEALTKKDFVRTLSRIGRVQAGKSDIRTAIYYFDDGLGISEIATTWNDTGPGINKDYVVQTSTKIIERCLLMTTDPGDLVLDPTCGSGTTAYVAENWGRRWITIDTSRVAIALARQRLLTGTFDYYRLNDESGGVAGGFVNKTVPHITRKASHKTSPWIPYSQNISGS